MSNEYVVNGNKINDNTMIELKPNPKRAGSMAHERYGIYMEAATVAELRELNPNYFMADMRYDNMKGFLTFLEEAEDKAKVEEVIEADLAAMVAKPEVGIEDRSYTNVVEAEVLVEESTEA